MEERRPISVVIAEELTLVREALVCLCEARGRANVLGQCGDGAAALILIESLKPDIALLDLELPKLATLEIVRRVRRSALPTKIVALSPRSDRKTVLEALRGGVHAFLPKSGPARHLVDSFEQVLNGGIYVSPQLEPDKLFGPHRDNAGADPFQTLSSREHQVFCLLVAGLRAKEIAARLDLSAKTVDTYRSNLMRKLDIHDVAGLVKFAIQRDLTSAR